MKKNHAQHNIYITLTKMIRYVHILGIEHNKRNIKRGTTTGNGRYDFNGLHPESEQISGSLLPVKRTI